jgi:hypothetical protein
MLRWRGRRTTYDEQVANALDKTVDLTPASQAPAAAVKAHWSALLPGQNIPLIGEVTRVYPQQEDPELRD